MKNIVSLLAVALFATVFAVGCGKYDKCGDAKKDECGKDDKFVDALKGKCEWKGDKCVEKETSGQPPAPVNPPPAPTYDATTEAADKKACEVDVATPADQAACDNAVISAAGKTAKVKCTYTEDKTDPSNIKKNCVFSK